MSTPNLNLSITPLSSGSSVLFQDWRLMQNGDNNSNATKIDAWAGTINTGLAGLRVNSFYPILGSSLDGITYTAVSPDITSYNNGDRIALRVDTTNVANPTLNINSLGIVSLYKVLANGNLSTLDAGDLPDNSTSLFVYDSNGMWVWIASRISSDMINVSATNNEIIVGDTAGGIKGSGLLVTSLSPGHTIQSNGLNVTQRPKLNILGSNITVADNALNDSTDISVAGMQLQAEGVDLTVRPKVNFIGGGVTASDNAVNNTTDITIPSPTLTKLDDLATPDDNTDLNASVSTHGLMPKLSGSPAKAWFGDGSQRLLDGWVPIASSGTYISAVSFSLPGDWSSLAKGYCKTRIVNAGVTKYGYIGSSSYNSSTDNTTITLVTNSDYLLASGAIGAVDLSFSHPADFPGWFNWVPALNMSGAVLSSYSKAKFQINNRTLNFMVHVANASITGTGTIGVGLPVAIPSYAVSSRATAYGYPLSGGYQMLRSDLSINTPYFGINKDITSGLWNGTETGMHFYISGAYEV